MPGQCYFQVAWLDKPEFRDWVGKVAEEKTSAYCRVCQKSISVRRLGVSALTTHAKGSKHMKAMRSVSSVLGNIDTLVRGDCDKTTTTATTTSLQTSGGAVQNKILTGGTETLNAEILWMLKQSNMSSKKRKILSECSSSGEEEPSQILAPIEDADLDESFNLRPWHDSKSQTLPHLEKTPVRISSTNGVDVKVERDQEHGVDAATFWGHCNTAGCTDAIFSDFLTHMKDVSLRIQNEQASQQDFVVAFKVMMASGKMTELLRKQEKELEQKQVAVENSLAVKSLLRS
ncbi:uncharacterized protein LOC127611613 isoform X2 [Hippocampus zosterae]|uniref:uncharacterized protein LOC127611613 isoform X2 n=2 Tax=Hippocampus zosterae TaxID=109293 RepID=UPI00223DAB88|nr:uncharacterized protein LOC127611613 isoform X2 [Hippocampus zosterae]